MKTPLPDNPELDRLSAIILEPLKRATLSNKPLELATSSRRPRPHSGMVSPPSTSTPLSTSGTKISESGPLQETGDPSTPGTTSDLGLAELPQQPRVLYEGPLELGKETSEKVLDSINSAPTPEQQAGLLSPPQSTPPISKQRKKLRLGGGILRRMRRGLKRGSVNVAIVNGKLLKRHGGDREKAKEEVLNMIDFMQRASMAAKEGGAV